MTDNFLIGSLNIEGSIAMMFEDMKVLYADCPLGCLAVPTSELGISLVGADWVRKLTEMLPAIPADIHCFGEAMITVEKTRVRFNLTRAIQ